MSRGGETDETGGDRAMDVAIGQAIRVQKHDYVSGDVVYSWAGTVIAADPDCIVVQAPFKLVSASPPTVDGVPLLPGDIFTEFYYLDRWYNVFHIADPTGRLKGWYCNVAQPATLSEAGLAFVDLCLDLFVHPDGAMAVLDEDEFAVAEASAHCDDDPVQARAALEVLIRLAREGQLPTIDGA
jgi:uncharacterized protein